MDKNFRVEYGTCRNCGEAIIGVFTAETYHATPEYVWRHTNDTKTGRGGVRVGLQQWLRFWSITRDKAVIRLYRDCKRRNKTQAEPEPQGGF